MDSPDAPSSRPSRLLRIDPRSTAFDSPVDSLTGLPETIGSQKSRCEEEGRAHQSCQDTADSYSTQSSHPARESREAAKRRERRYPSWMPTQIPPKPRPAIVRQCQFAAYETEATAAAPAASSPAVHSQSKGVFGF